MALCPHSDRLLPAAVVVVHRERRKATAWRTAGEQQTRERRDLSRHCFCCRCWPRCCRLLLLPFRCCRSWVSLRKELHRPPNRPPQTHCCRGRERCCCCCCCCQSLQICVFSQQQSRGIGGVMGAISQGWTSSVITTADGDE